MKQTPLYRYTDSFNSSWYDAEYEQLIDNFGCSMSDLEAGVFLPTGAVRPETSEAHRVSVDSASGDVLIRCDLDFTLTLAPHEAIRLASNILAHALHTIETNKELQDEQI